MARWIRSLLIVVVAGCVAWAVLAAKSTPPKPTPPGSTVETKVGATFRIVIESNASTGYKWVPDLSGQDFELVREDYKEGLGRPGAPGTQVFELKALKSGTFNLRFDYVRPWEGQPVEQVEYTVVVK